MWEEGRCRKGHLCRDKRLKRLLLWEEQDLGKRFPGRDIYRS